MSNKGFNDIPTIFLSPQSVFIIDIDLAMHTISDFEVISEK